MSRQGLGAYALTPRTWKGTERRPGTAPRGPGALHLLITARIFTLFFRPHIRVHHILLNFLDPILVMSTQTLQSLYSQIRTSPSASHVGLCVFVSLDGHQFHSYPPSIFGLSPNTFESVLPSLRPRLAVQASSPGIQAAIREAYVLSESVLVSH